MKGHPVGAPSAWVPLGLPTLSPQELRHCSYVITSLANWDVGVYGINRVYGGPWYGGTQVHWCTHAQTEEGITSHLFSWNNM